MSRSTRRVCAILVGLASAIASAHAVPISGIYNGTFITPVPGVPPAVVSGLGSSSVSWGVPCNGVTNCLTSPGGITPPSSFTFTAALFAAEVDQPFVLGTIRFFNGTVMPGTALNQVTLFLDGFQITPTEFAGSDSRVITIVNTPNTVDPIASADRAVIPQAVFPAANEFGVLESQSAIATLYGTFHQVAPGTLDLDINGFGEVVSGSGFLTGFAPEPVPEPPVLALLGLGMAILAWSRLTLRRE